MPFITIYMRDQGFQLGQAGTVIAAYGAGNLIASGYGGHLADTFGRRRTIILSMCLGALSMILLSQATIFLSLLSFTFLAGLASEFYRPAAAAMLVDLVPEENRATAWAAYRVAFNAGWAAGPATAGFLYKYSYFWLFLGDAITSLLFAMVAFVALPKGLRGSEASRGWRGAFAVLKTDRAFLLYLIAVMGPGILFFQIHTTFSAHLRLHGFTSETYGLLISFNGVLIMLFELPITTITRRFPFRPTLAIGFLTIGAGLAISGLGTSLWILVLAMTVFTLGEMISMPQTGAFISTLAPEDMRGRYMGVSGCMWSLAMMIGPALGLWAYEISPAVFWWGCLLLGALSAGVISIDPSRKPQS